MEFEGDDENCARAYGYTEEDSFMFSPYSHDMNLIVARALKKTYWETTHKSLKEEFDEKTPEYAVKTRSIRKHADFSANVLFL